MNGVNRVFVRAFRIGFTAALVAAALGAPLASAPLERDLGEGLTYFRVRSVPADLPSDAAIQNRSAVVDLRFAKGDSAAPTLVAGWMKFHASPKAIRFVLVNGATDPHILAGLRDRSATPGLLVIGIAGQSFPTDIAVTQSSDDEKRAFEALEAGTDIVTLITDNPAKQRNDEASLSRDRPNGASDAGDDALEPKARAEKTPPLDAALQRAVHLHRALKVVRKR